MIKDYEVNATCTKIAILLCNAESYRISRNDILYCLAISDFVSSDIEMNSKSIRNINSLLYYSNILNKSIAKMNEHNLLFFEGVNIAPSFSCRELYKMLSKVDQSCQLITKVKFAYEYGETGKFLDIYNELYENYLKEKILLEVN